MLAKIAASFPVVLALGCDLQRFESDGVTDCEQSQNCVDQTDSGANDPDDTPGQQPATPPTESPPATSMEGGAPAPTAPNPDAPEAGSSAPPDTTDPGDDAADCNQPSTASVRAYFEVPGAADAELGDYFRLPFPNDYYVSNGQPDLGEFPAATAAAQAFVDAVEEASDGFGASPTILFRFSGAVDFATLRERFHLLDVTDPASGSSPPLKLLYSPSGGKYVCHNSLAARPGPGHALLPGRTYAAWIDTGVISEQGLEVQRSPVLAAMLSDAEPGEVALTDLYGKFRPFREYLAASDADPDAILNATVFTVGDVREPMRRLAERVMALPAPSGSGWIKCDGEGVSPCPDTTGGRACGTPASEYDEYHAMIELPIFQQGTPPYLAEGGAVAWDGPTRTENVCVSITVPTQAPPASGFPVVVSAHGAGGSFRSHVGPNAAGALSQGVAVDGTPVSFVVVGYDGVQHGPRRGDDPQTGAIDPDLLLFNFLNPVGTLGTSLQGGLDVLTMARFAKTLSIPDAVTGSAQVPLDTSRVLFWGHSQGAMQGAIALPYTDDVHAAVFSGLGAGFLQTLLLRKDPPLIPQAVRQAVFDPGPDGALVFGGEFHPALALVQQLIDPVDPLHHAPHLVTRPDGNPLHVFQIYGTDDAFSPGIAQQSFAIAAGLDVVRPDPSAATLEYFGVPSAAYPLSANRSVAGVEWTAGVRLYGPLAGNNGHFVAFQVDSARQDLVTFLATAAASNAAQIGR